MAKKKIIEFLFMLGVIVEHTITIAFFMIGIFAINWLATKLGLGSSYAVTLLREISEYALLGIYTVFVIAGIIYIYKIFKDLEVE
ncbi:MAG: hypothetical protein PHH85_03490 [Candidatus Methanoperedens sp.]|nr:hypothetical protein [Candidatus Methanoperedens sp.]